MTGVRFTEGTGAQRDKVELRLVMGLLASHEAGWGQGWDEDPGIGALLPGPLKGS